MNQREQEPKKGREIPKKMTQRAKEISKLIPVTKLMYRETGQDGGRVRRAHGAPSKVMPLELKFHVRKKKR